MSLSTAAGFAVAHWPLDEGSGTRVDSVNGYNLTDNNTVLSGTGVFGDAALFDRDNDESLTVADNADLSGGDVKLVFRAWIKLASKANNQAIICKSGAGDAEYQIRYRPGADRFDFVVYSAAGYGGAAAVTADNLGSPSTGTWYLIHAWHDPDANLIGIAVNAGTADTTSHSAGIYNSTDAFRLSTYASGANQEPFDGLMDDVVVLRGYVLDATERTEDYNSGTGVAFENWAAPAALDDYDWQIQHPQPDRSPIKVVSY
jgi:hypothetical protein